MLLRRDVQLEPDHPRGVREQDGQEHDEAGAEERAENAAEAADDDHEQHEERNVDVEGEGLRAAEIEENQSDTGHAHIERADREGEELRPQRSEEHTSELQSLMRISYAVFCLKKKK